MYTTDPKPCAKQVKMMEAHGFVLVPTTDCEFAVYWRMNFLIKQQPYDFKIRLSNDECPTPWELIKLCVWKSYYDGETNRAKMIKAALNCEDLPK